MIEKNEYGQTPLHLALENKDVSNFNKLIRSISAQEEKDNLLFTQDAINNYTVLHLAALYNNFEIAKIILNNVSKEKLLDLINKPAEYEITALDLAIQSNSIEVIELIFNKLISEEIYELITAQDKDENNLFHKITKSNKPELLKLFINQIPKEEISNILNIKNKNGLTIIDIAQQSQYSNILNILSSFNSKDKNDINISNLVDETKGAVEEESLNISHKWRNMFKKDPNVVVEDFEVKTKDKTAYVVIRFKKDKYEEYINNTLGRSGDPTKYGSIIHISLEPISKKDLTGIKEQAMREDFLFIDYDKISARSIS